MQQCRNAMVEYEMADSGISQVLSQDGVNRAALFRREGFAFAKLVHGFFICASVRSFVKISSANARKEADNSCSVAVLSASACSVAVLSASSCPLAVLIVSECIATLLHHSLKLCSLALPALSRVTISHIRLCSNSSRLPYKSRP